MSKKRWATTLPKKRSSERLAWQLRLEGHGIEEIADRLQTTPAVVVRWCQAIELRLHQQLTSHTAAHKVRVTERYDMILQEALGEYRRSQLPAEITTSVEGLSRVNEVGQITALPTRVTRTIKGRTGESALLMVALRCMEGIRELWGLDSTAQGLDEGAKAGDSAAEALDRKLTELATRIQSQTLPEFGETVITEDPPSGEVDSEVVDLPARIGAS